MKPHLLVSAIGSGCAAAVALGLMLTPAVRVIATEPPDGTIGGLRALSCRPTPRALGFSDALNKLNTRGAQVGGISALSYDPARRTYAAIADHSGDRTARIWFFRNAADPRVTGTLVLRHPDGRPFVGADMDAEGLVVLPDGGYLVSSEISPSIRVFDGSGRQTDDLPVPSRVHQPPVGQATVNASLEGLTMSPDGRTVYAAMEGTLTGDVTESGDDSYRRIVSYSRSGSRYSLNREIGYHADPGNRISEVAAYGSHGLLVMETAYDPDVGNTVALYAIDTRQSPDVRSTDNLGDRADLIAPKTLVADVTTCRTPHASAKNQQANPLMANYEGMVIRPLRRCRAEVVLISDDNFSEEQTTRVLRLRVTLP